MPVYYGAVDKYKFEYKLLVCWSLSLYKVDVLNNYLQCTLELLHFSYFLEDICSTLRNCSTVKKGLITHKFLSFFF